MKRVRTRTHKCEFHFHECECCQMLWRHCDCKFASEKAHRCPSCGRENSWKLTDANGNVVRFKGVAKGRLAA